MKRCTIALAVAGVFALPGLAAAQSTVQIYGNVNIGFENVDSGVANTGGSRNRITNPGGSKIGFRGTERLSGGTSAFFQIESNINGVDGTTTGSWGLGSRNTGVGLQGGWGWFVAGHWDAPYKNFAGRLQPFGATTLGGTTGIMNNNDNSGAVPTPAGATGTFAAGATVAWGTAQPGSTSSFHRRLANTIQYQTPSLSGFTGRVAYSPGEGKAANANPSLWSFSGVYDNGPLFVGLAYEKHKEFSFVGRDDTGWMLGAQYRFPFGLELGLGYERLKYEATVLGANQDATRNAWQLHAQFRTGPHRFGGMYIKANDTSGSYGTVAAPVFIGNITANGGAGNTGANQWTLLYGYSLSKRTEVTLAYSRLSNDSQALYDYNHGNVAAASATSFDATRKGYAATIYHSF